MIFVCLGTQIYQLNRLLIELDRLLEKGLINDDVFAQIGSSDYIPKNFEYKNFLNTDEYNNVVSSCDVVISHGGTGAIVKALKAGKQVIAVPRMKKFHEHSDDHQFQIVDFFNDNGYIVKVDKMNDLLNAVNQLNENPISKKFKGDGEIITLIDKYIQQSSK